MQGQVNVEAERIKVIIVEDEKNSADVLEQYLERYGETKGIEFDLRRYDNVSSFLCNYNNSADLILMDIELPDGDGMSAIAKIRERDTEVTVIFVTNMSQYAVKGYEVRALDFIVKPVLYSNFSVKLANAVAVIRQRVSKEIWISNKEGKMCVRSSRILYIEVAKHMLVFHTLDGDYTQSRTLSNIQAELAGEPFSLCNRCYLVNLRYVTAVKQFDVYLGKHKLQISRLKRVDFMRDLNNYLAKGC